MKTDVGRRIGILNLCLTTICALVFVIVLVLGRVRALRAGPVDLPAAMLFWSYVILTPIASVAALAVGDRRTARIRLNWGALFLWAVFLAWTATLTL